jgi:GNAT superfamily N-acetyltransferase
MILPAASRAPFPLIRAVLEGSQGGRVFADARSGASFVVTCFGFAQWVGQEARCRLDGVIEGLLARPEQGLPRYWHWYAPPPHWEDRLEAEGPARMRRRARWRSVFEGTMPALPAPDVLGFELRLLDATLLHQASPLGVDLESRFWRSGSDFLARGLGLCALQDGRIVSLCYAACVTGGLAEVDIVTLPEYRKQGLGRLVAHRFIRECLARGIRPTWDCFTENVASMDLARKLGFGDGWRYPLYSFNVPLDVAARDDHSALGGIVK